MACSGMAPTCPRSLYPVHSTVDIDAVGAVQARACGQACRPGRLRRLGPSWAGEGREIVLGAPAAPSPYAGAVGKHRPHLHDLICSTSPQHRTYSRKSPSPRVSEQRPACAAAFRFGSAAWRVSPPRPAVRPTWPCSGPPSQVISTLRTASQPVVPPRSALGPEPRLPGCCAR